MESEKGKKEIRNIVKLKSTFSSDESSTDLFFFHDPFGSIQDSWLNKAFRIEAINCCCKKKWREQDTEGYSVLAGKAFYFTSTFHIFHFQITYKQFKWNPSLELQHQNIPLTLYVTALFLPTAYAPAKHNKHLQLRYTVTFFYCSHLIKLTSCYLNDSPDIWNILG